MKKAVAFVFCLLLVVACKAGGSDPSPDLDPVPDPSCQHEWGDVMTVEPTCEHTGMRYHVCSLCQDVSVIETLEVLPHSYVWKYDFDYHWRKCSLCGHTTDAQLHNWVERSGKFECDACSGSSETDNITGGGGIGVEFEYRGPQCNVTENRVAGTNAYGYHNYEFSIADSNPKSPGMTVVWNVDGVQVKKENNCSASSYTLEVSKRVVYDVSIVYYNAHGGGNYVSTVKAD